MKRVIIESPFAGDRKTNIEYAKAALLDSINRGEAPIAFHLLYPQVLEDNKRVERAQALRMSFMWYHAAELVAVYEDMGVSPGMLDGLQAAGAAGLQIEYRRLPTWSE